MSRLLRFVLTTLIFSFPLLAQPQVEGLITSDTAWSPGAGSTIEVTGTVTIPSGITLTIDSTMQVKFNPSTGLIVEGKIIAAGVTFTSNASGAPGYWNGIEFQTSANDSSIFRSNTVLYAGGGSNGAGIYYPSGVPINISIIGCSIVNTAGNGINVGASSPLIKGTTLQLNTGYAVYSDLISNFTLDSCMLTNNANGVRIPINSNPVISGNSILNQSGIGIYIDNNAYPDIHNNAIVNNATGIQLSGSFSPSLKINYNMFDNNSLWAVENKGQSVIDAQYNFWGDDKGPLHTNNPNTGGDKVSDYVDYTPWKTLGGTRPFKTITADIVEPTTWYPDTVYIVNNYITISSELTIFPGTVIKLSPIALINVSGLLAASGTPDSLIVFTSLKDDMHGGDTNGDSTATEPSNGDWDGVRLSSSAGSALKYCLFQYGGSGYWGYNNGNLHIEYCAPAISHVYSTNSATHGISVNNSPVAFDTVTVSGNVGDGFYIYDGSDTIRSCTVQGNGGSGIYISSGGGPAADIKVRDSFIKNNGNSGLYAYSNGSYGATFSEVSNCIIQGNAQHGIVTEGGLVPQTYINNQIKFNGMEGLRLYSPLLNANDIQLIGNIITDNGGIGALTTASRFVANTFERNNYPIGVWGKLGNIYDAGGVNIINQNTFNNAIAIVDDYLKNLKGTLDSVFPLAIPSKVYHVISYIGIDGSDTLVIQPGTKIKFFNDGEVYYSFDIYGTLFAEGTQAEPIIFTSWRDSTAGGKTALPGDMSPAAPGDWAKVNFSGGSDYSRIRYCEFKYGGAYSSEQVSFNYTQSTLAFSHNRVAFSSSDGIGFHSAVLTLDSNLVEYNNGNGIAANYYSLDYRLNSLRFSGAPKLYEKTDRVAAGPDVLQILNTTVAHNQSDGLKLLSYPGPVFVIGSRFISNGNDGMNINSSSMADTAILIKETSITGNDGVGVVSSRAYFENDTISANQFAIGVTRQLSLDGTGNASGNVYSANSLQGNMYDGVIVCEGYVEGNLGYSLPSGYASGIFTNRGEITVDYETVLNIAPGTVFRFQRGMDANAGLTVNSQLNAVGQSNKKIVFTSWKDTTYSGSVGIDTTMGDPQPGDWDWIYLYSGSNSLIRYAVIKYGDEGLYFNNNNSTVDSSTISRNMNGVYIAGGTPVIFTNKIHHNDNGIYISGNSSPAINYNNIDSNSVGLYAYYVSTIIDAANNYWGSSTGPFKDTGDDSLQNLSGAGNPIYVNGPGDVNWKPSLLTPHGILFGDASQNGQVTAYDASLALQHDVEIITLNPVQQLAANVDGIDSVTSNDASLILQYVVGLITGFPAGLEKRLLATDALSAFTFQIEKNQEPDQFDLIVHLNKPVNVFSASVKLTYDTTLITPLSMRGGEASDSMLLVHYFPKGKANVALAGIHPLNVAGDIVRFTFKIENAGRARETILFTLNKFLLNGIDVAKDAGNIILDVKQVLDVPTTFALGQNYPNPFNPTTTIKYQVPEESRVTITIYNMLGQRVRTLVNGLQTAGYYTLQWNGSDERGASVASGVYIYRIEAVSPGNKKFMNAKKMILIK